MKKYGKQTLAVVLASQLALGGTLVGAPVVSAEPEPFGDSFEVKKIGEYVVGSSADGGVAEIVKFNKDNGRFYLVNGAANPPSLDIVTLGNGSALTKERSVMVKTLAETEGFVFGDLTSVDVNTEIDRIFVAVQAEGALEQGKILELDYAGNLIRAYAAGVQPDMIKSTPDGRYVMTADEAEPRLGFSEDPEVGLQDAPGSVTIVDRSTGDSTQVYFEDVAVIDDDVHIRNTLEPDGKVITGKGPKSHAYLDFEPEYIALSDPEDEEDMKAYVVLQENNAIATIDIESQTVESVKSLGFKDHSLPGNELDLLKNSEIQLQNAPFKGVYMPDGMASYTIGETTYLFTANEGDATEWDNLENIAKIEDVKGDLTVGTAVYDFLHNVNTYNKVEVLTDRGNDGIYLFGGRSFSIWNADTMDQVYDSGSDFETITADRLPDYFNVSNDKAEMDGRSTKKGPEPEDIKVGTVGNKALAFIGLERIGGVMTYDVTNPVEPQFMNYTNTRDFEVIDVVDDEELNLSTDTGPEGIEFIPATESPTGLPLLLVAFEVGGRVGVYELGVTKVTLNHKMLSLTTGNAATQLTATVDAMGDGEETVTWTSSDATVASVDANGNVRPLKAGSTVITAISEDGYGIAETTVSVSNPYYPVDPTPTPSPTPTPTPTTTPVPTTTPTPETPEFSDVFGHWAAEPINKLAEKKILEGMPDGSFQPDSQMTRAQYMAVLFRLLGLEESDSSQGFNDVADDAWYSTYVNALSEFGIATGYPDGSFQPDKEMTREEAFVLLYRAVKDSLPEGSGAAPTFDDSADVSDWAQEAIAALVEAGVVEGSPDGKLNPQGTITRAEIAKIIAAFVE
ncbi:choice-of-anchor I family protein [Paenibacillus sp. strain BS8-2]